MLSSVNISQVRNLKENLESLMGIEPTNFQETRVVSSHKIILASLRQV